MPDVGLIGLCCNHDPRQAVVAVSSIDRLFGQVYTGLNRIRRRNRRRRRTQATVCATF